MDIATLTGAATLGLGRRHAALFSNSDALAAGLAAAGEAAGESMWRMPLHSEYADLIASEVADQANAESRPGPGPGAITAALFLPALRRRSTPGRTWTSPGWAARTPSATTCPRAAPGSAPALCCAGSKPAPPRSAPHRPRGRPPTTGKLPVQPIGPLSRGPIRDSSGFRTANGRRSGRTRGCGGPRTVAEADGREGAAGPGTAEPRPTGRPPVSPGRAGRRPAGRRRPAAGWA